MATPVTNVADINQQLAAASASILNAKNSIINMLANLQQTATGLNALGTTYATLINNVAANVAANPTNAWVALVSAPLAALESQAGAITSYANSLVAATGAVQVPAGT